MNGEEASWVEQARGGSTDAFARLMESYQGKVYNQALRMTSSPEDAADIAQEVFWNAWRGLPAFQGDSAFSTWLYRMTANACIDFFRGKKRRQGAGLVSLDDEETGCASRLPDPRLTPHEEAERLELREAVSRGLEQLSDEHRQVLVLREINGLSYTEIAETLRLEEGTVKSRIARARLALRKVLLADGNFSSPVSSKAVRPGKGGDEDGV